MASTATKVEYETSAGPAIMRPVETPAAVCGECAFHMPHATRPGGWCACDAADAEVEAGLGRSRRLRRLRDLAAGQPGAGVHRRHGLLRPS